MESDLKKNSIESNILNQSIPPETLIWYVRRGFLKKKNVRDITNFSHKEREVAMTFVAIPKDDKLLIGFSVCSPRERSSNKKVGRNIAIQRAIWWENMKVLYLNKIPEILKHKWTFFEAFLLKCNNRRSFQGKQFPEWVNRYFVKC